MTTPPRPERQSDEPTHEVPKQYDPMAASYILMGVVRTASQAAAKAFGAWERDEDKPSLWTEHVLRLISNIEGELNHARDLLSARGETK